MEFLNVFMRWSGYGFWGLILLFFAWWLFEIIRIHLFVSISYFLIQLEADAEYPKANCIEQEIKQKRFWKLKLFWSSFGNIEQSLHWDGCTVTGTGFVADFQDRYPKTRLEKPLCYRMAEKAN